jgi:hypothetical protein
MSAILSVIQQWRGVSLAKFALAISAVLILWRPIAPTAAMAGELDYPTTDYTIRSIDGAQVIGHAHVTLIPEAGGLTTARGEYTFLDGEHDTDETTLRARNGDELPLLVRSHHVFFHADGSLDRESRADVAARTASCTVYENGQPQTTNATLDFPADSFAGDAVILPLRQFLQTGGKGSISFHDFACIPSPKLLKVIATPHPSAPWNYYPGELVQVNVEPDLGWLNVVVSPFLPRIQAWFDPRDRWLFVGGESARYYKGLKFMMVRVHDTNPEIKAAPQHHSDHESKPEPQAQPTPHVEPSPAG